MRKFYWTLFSDAASLREMCRSQLRNRSDAGRLCMKWTVVLCIIVRTSVVTADEASKLATPRDVSFSESELRRLSQHLLNAGPIVDPSNSVIQDPKAIEFGRSLFFDRRFSSNGEVGCVTCHDPKKSWCDNKEVGIGIEKTERNVPTLYNVGFQRWFFWDGRADSLWAQALGPLENPKEHGTDRVAIVREVISDPELRAKYESVFGGLPNDAECKRLPVHATPLREDGHEFVKAWKQMSEHDRRRVNVIFAQVGKSIAAFVGTIRSEPTPFDLFVEGLRDGDQLKMSAISTAAKRGAKLFAGKANCRACHSGAYFTDGEFHSLGLAARNADQYVDSGRLQGIESVKNDPFNKWGEFSDLDTDHRVSVEHLIVDGSKWGQFKTPSLRNVSRTGPYMHDGRFSSLREVVEYYSTLKGAAEVDHHEEQVLAPLKLQEQEIDDLVAFLESLSFTTD